MLSARKKELCSRTPYREIRRAAEKEKQWFCTQFVPEADIFSRMCLDDIDDDDDDADDNEKADAAAADDDDDDDDGAILPNEKRTHPCEVVYLSGVYLSDVRPLVISRLCSLRNNFITTIWNTPFSPVHPVSSKGTCI